jgi:uncharacterized protein (TIGR00375 family)
VTINTETPGPPQLSLFAADLHVHIGASSEGKPVKITASRDLTFANIATECVQRKGLDLVGIVDCASPRVMRDMAALLESGEMVPQAGGGFRYQDRVTLIPASEVETRETGGGMSHSVGYFRDWEGLAAFSTEVGKLVTNSDLSSQACGLPIRELGLRVEACGGLFVPAHAFTPHKSLYGACVERAAGLLGEGWARIPAIELGLSADTDLADRMGELAEKTFLTNSDAHSLPKIAREYNLLELAAPTWEELRLALERKQGRRVAANFGLDPRLGKYHRTCCEECGHIAQGAPPVLGCEACGSEKVTRGVLDRIVTIADFPEPRHPAHRPPYQYQVPLQFVPGVGPVALRKLINRFGSEMAVLHQATEEELTLAVGAKIARLIGLAREGRLALASGGGGTYGKALARAASGQLGLVGLG